MSQKVYLMRHGQTLFNLKKKIQGASDSPLTKKGIAQAKIARDHFKEVGIRFDAAYSSTQERASDTLEIVTDNQLPYKRVKGLKEWNFGIFESESEALNPQLPYGDFFVGYGGESQDEVIDRMVETMHDIMSNEDGQHVLIVSHGAAIINFLRTTKQGKAISGGREIGFTNCSALVFEYDQGEFNYIDVINHDYSHLVDGE